MQSDRRARSYGASANRHPEGSFIFASLQSPSPTGIDIHINACSFDFLHV